MKLGALSPLPEVSGDECTQTQNVTTGQKIKNLQDLAYIGFN